MIDLGIITAGASTSAILADLGADVIKVENPDSLDPFRIWDASGGSGDWWNQSRFFQFTNRNKRGVSLDLKAREGRALLLGLVARSDVVVENFRRGVLERLDITYQTLAATNPRIVLASITSQGETGPERTSASFGSTLEATSGLASLTGYPHDEPVVSGISLNYPDQVVSLFAAGMVLAALAARRDGGRGAHLDISQRELASFLIGEAIVAGAGDTRVGNASPECVGQECFRAADGRWVAASPADGEGPFGSLGHEGLASWVAKRGADDAAGALRAAGTPAEKVHDGVEILASIASEGGAALARSDDGRVVKGVPFRIGGKAHSVERVAPALGEHTAEVLRDVLGLDEGELSRLLRSSLTRNAPAGAQSTPEPSRSQEPIQ
ncbi:MAG: CoA transferase [Burkholderiaceae bacterium]|nr:CoA transferase [Burkholderiaceae bacterium]